MTKTEEIVTLALAGHPNSEIAEIVGSRPRRVREVISAAMKAGAPIAPNADRMASRRARNGPPALSGFSAFTLPLQNQKGKLSFFSDSGGLMDLAALRLKLRRQAEKLLGNDVRTRRFIQVVLVAGGSEALSNADPFAAWKPYLVTLWVVGLGLSFLGTLFLLWVERSEPEILIEAEKTIAEAENRAAIIGRLEEDFLWFSRLYALSNFLREIVEQVALQGSGDEAEQAKRFGFMLDLLVADKGVLFGMNDDRWNFAIYLFNLDSGELECVACRRPIRAEEEAPHRSWKPGIGHVGIAFQTARTIVAADTSEPEARALFDAPEGLRNPDDIERYRSIASVPIRLQDENPIGVVVGTSDVPGRFRLKRPDDDAARDPVEPIRSLAIHLAMLNRVIHLWD